MTTRLSLDGYEPFAATLRKARGAQPVTRDLAERFLRDVTQGDTQGNGCWTWTGYHSPDGHGMFSLGRNGTISPARMAWILYHRCSPAARTRVTWTCGNTTCIRPDHVHLGAHVFTPVADQADVDDGTAASIEDMTPPMLRRLAAVQFGDGARDGARDGASAPTRVASPPPPPAASPIPTKLYFRAAQTPQSFPLTPAPTSPIALDDVLALLSRPGTALVTYPSGETSLVSPLGVHRDRDLLALLIRALTDAGYRKVAA